MLTLLTTDSEDWVLSLLLLAVTWAFILMFIRAATLELRQRWWKRMGDVMPSNPDHSPVAKGLKEVFHLE